MVAWSRLTHRRYSTCPPQASPRGAAEKTDLTVIFLSVWLVPAALPCSKTWLMRHKRFARSTMCSRSHARCSGEAGFVVCTAGRAQNVLPLQAAWKAVQTPCLHLLAWGCTAMYWFVQSCARLAWIKCLGFISCCLDRWTGDVRFADFYERALLNGAQLRMCPVCCSLAS